MIDDILSGIQKPARYIGREWNASKKDFSAARISFALAFADMYEVGMSNLGMRIIYGLLNTLDDVACERFFSPAPDMEQALRRSNAPIFSLESRRGLKAFDFAGFSLGHELNYSNVLAILELGGLPLWSKERDHTYPLVIGGGPCALNPEPLADFFDLFVIGEAEEAIIEIIDLWREEKSAFKAGRLSKDELLRKFSGISGVYVPCLYEAHYAEDGRLIDFSPRTKGPPATIRKRFLKDLNSAYFPREWLVPYIQIAHDRVTLEITRGCPNTCRFCQARPQYFPYRIRKPEEVIGLAKECYRRTGYEELSLTGLSVSDYPHLGELTAELVRLFKEKGVSVSLPSIKPNVVLEKLSSLIATIKKTGLTFAPEAGSIRLRRALGKEFDIPEFMRTLEAAYRSGYQHVKLYFMIGIPGEENQDLEALIELSGEVSELRRKTGQGPAQVNISINALIPKPHTAMQWCRMEGLQSIKEKQDYLRQRLKKHRRIQFRFHNYQMSYLEGIFSRGDRRLSQVIRLAYVKGARFDAWDEYFSFSRWMESFQEAGIDPDFYLHQRPAQELLPWDFIDTGIPKESLINSV